MAHIKIKVVGDAGDGDIKQMYVDVAGSGKDLIYLLAALLVKNEAFKDVTKASVQIAEGFKNGGKNKDHKKGDKNKGRKCDNCGGYHDDEEE